MPKNIAEMELKSIATEIKAADEEGVFEGYFSVFGNVDDGGDVVEKGCWAKTLMESKERVKVFYAHDPSKVIAPTPEVLQEDSFGLYAKGRLILDSFWGKEVWALIKENAINEGSIGYRAIKYDFDEDNYRHLREAKLYEISPVPLGMNALTAIRAAKSAIAGLYGVSGLTDEVAPIDTLTNAITAINQFMQGDIFKSLELDEATLGNFDASLSALNRTHDNLMGALKAAKPIDNHLALLDLRVREVKLKLTK